MARKPISASDPDEARAALALNPHFKVMDAAELAFNATEDFDAELAEPQTKAAGRTLSGDAMPRVKPETTSHE